MRNRIKVLSTALALAASGLAVGLGSGVAAAQTGVTLPITSFYQIVADPANGYLFISQGSSSVNEILVTNLAGQEVGSIGGQDGVMGISLSADGSTLYAALSADHSVTAISTSTLEQTASYPIGDANIPQDVAVQSGKVWVSYSTGTAGSAAIGDIDLTAASPAFETQANMGGWTSAPQIAGDPQDTGVLVAALPGSDPGSVASYDVSVDPATATAPIGSIQNCENEEDLAVVPGGSEFILACGYPYAFYRYNTADLTEQGSYAGTNYPDSVAIDSNGDVAGGAFESSPNPDVYVYQQGADTPVNTFNLENSGDGFLAAQGLAWAPDGSELFAVLYNYNGQTTTYTLDVIQEPTLTQPTLTLTGPSSAEVTKSIKLTGSLTLAAGAAAPAGTAITISRAETGSTTVANFTVTTGSNGSFSLTDTPPAVGSYTYTASYAGTSTIAPASTSETVAVTYIPTSLTVTASPTTATYEPTIHVTAHLGTTYTGRTVSIYALPLGSSSKRLLKTGTVNSHGDLSVSYRAPHSTKFSAVFGGDSRYASTTVSRTVHVRARVSESLSGYYGTRHTGGHAYRLFHRKKIMRVHVSVAPNKRGECVEFNLELYYQGSWYSEVTGCADLSKSSTLTVGIKLNKASIGYHYRIQADYIPGTDTSNLGNDSAWQYFIVEK